MVSFVLMCSCVVIKLCQFLQNLRNHTFPFISYIASQFRKISLPSLVDVFSDVFLAISLSALQGNFRRNALPSVLRALLYIASEFRKIYLPSIDDVLSELWLAIGLLTRTIQCHRISLPKRVRIIWYQDSCVGGFCLACVALFLGVLR